LARQRTNRLPAVRCALLPPVFILYPGAVRRTDRTVIMKKTFTILLFSPAGMPTPLYLSPFALRHFCGQHVTPRATPSRCAHMPAWVHAAAPACSRAFSNTGDNRDGTSCRDLSRMANSWTKHGFTWRLPCGHPGGNFDIAENHRHFRARAHANLASVPLTSPTPTNSIILTHRPQLQLLLLTCASPFPRSTRAGGHCGDI